MKTWREFGLGATPKEHIFEDRAIQSMQNLNGIDDNTKYFIKFNHQDGAR